MWTLIQVLSQVLNLGVQKKEGILETEEPVSRKLWLGLSLPYFYWEFPLFLSSFILSKKVGVTYNKGLCLNLTTYIFDECTIYRCSQRFNTTVL